MVKKIKRTVKKIEDSESECSYESEEDDYDSYDSEEEVDNEKLFLQDVNKALNTNDLKKAIINIFMMSYKWILKTI